MQRILWNWLGLIALLQSTAFAEPPTTAADAQPAAKSVADRPADILRAGKWKVDLMDAVLSPRVIELSQKMQKAIQADPSYWQEALQKAEPGKPLPYDARCGLTKEEYAEYLKGVGERTVEKVGTAEIEIKEPSPAVFVFDGGETLPELTGIEIDLKKAEVRTRVGTASKQSEYETGADSPIGKCTGVEWSMDGLLTTIRVSVSRQHATGKGLIYFRITSPLSNPPAKIRRVIGFETKAVEK